MTMTKITKASRKILKQKAIQADMTMPEYLEFILSDKAIVWKLEDKPTIDKLESLVKKFYQVNAKQDDLAHDKWFSIIIKADYKYKALIIENYIQTMISHEELYIRFNGETVDEMLTSAIKLFEEKL